MVEVQKGSTRLGRRGTRKLLAASGIQHDFWPFVAVLHASNCNWTNLCEELGAPMANLLPFGLVLQARRRLKVSDKSSWEGRTLPGRYLGHAPNTPGGHLVWATDPKLGPKVLLTSTVFPLHAEAERPLEPKRRLVHKTSPRFALSSISAAPIESHAAHLFSSAVTKLSPGGEWGTGDENFLDSEDAAAGPLSCPGERLEGSALDPNKV